MRSTCMFPCTRLSLSTPSSLTEAESSKSSSTFLKSETCPSFLVSGSSTWSTRLLVTTSESGSLSKSRIAMNRLQRNATSWSTLTLRSQLRSVNLSISAVSIPSIFKVVCTDHHILFGSIATKGRGVHILKAGSKRRRTQAEMQD